MKNMAGVLECNVQLIDELQKAGIPVREYENREKREVPSFVYGELCGWTFKRAWYYWVAYGNPIPVDVARNMNVEWREDIRVDGYAGGTDVDWRKSNDVGVSCYHIDTQEGLNHLASVIRSVFEENND